MSYIVVQCAKIKKNTLCASFEVIFNILLGADDVIRRELEQSCRRNLDYYNSEVYRKSENYRDIGRYYGESVISIPICTKEKLKKSSDNFHISLNQLYGSYNHDLILIIKSYTKGTSAKVASNLSMNFIIYLFFVNYLVPLLNSYYFLIF